MYSYLELNDIDLPSRISRYERKIQRRIRPSLHKIIYIWPKFGDGFLAWITERNCTCINGYRWNHRSWVKFRMNLEKIMDFRED
ncbi:hypothetical protein [Clostridium guangxiense]|uniref:hypothetical protein n=1 Tax=Clostridium guangxiense TaxID=1662055 RepID=UPI001E51B58C|nr:hypothetical protein [Clostridium guangxiense]MCD2346752.1 hypothetical protein [Clostridium guangxiense]